MSNLYIPMTRVAYVTTENTGEQCQITTGQGVVRLDRVDPHGVLIVAAGQEFGVTPANLPYIGRFFLAAALKLGVDINEGWDAPQHRADTGS